MPDIWPFFADIVETGETYAYDWPMTADEGRDLWFAVSGRTAVAVDDDGTVLGSSKMGPNRPGRGAHIGTASFMTSPAAQGKGVARALAQDMLSWSREQGYRGVQFNAVVETNAAAVHLWQALGFDIIGTVPGAFRHPSGSFVGLHVMFKDLRP